MQPPAEPRPVQNQLLGDENVLVLTKARFFRTLRILLDYAQHPERRTWEFFSYRPWDYILGTYCLTFDLHEWAARLEYAQPDFTLMANSFGKEGELLFLGEAKAMGKVEPDTVNAYNLASAAFLVAEPQRKRQARLAFERHPESDLINILMMCGSFWSVWSYKRSTFRFDLPPPASDLGRGETDDQIPPSSDARNHPSPDRSPPYKIRRTNKTSPDKFISHIWHQDEENDPSRSHDDDDLSDFSPIPSPPYDRKDPTWRPDPEEQPLDSDVDSDHHPKKSRKGGKKTTKAKKAKKAKKAEDQPQAKVHHILQLPNKDVLNPWFRHFLKKTRDTLTSGAPEKGSVQSSWFDWNSKEAPVGNGHDPGYVLPNSKEVLDSDEQLLIVELVRADEPPEMPNVNGLPLNQVAANALMSPRLSLPPSSGRAGSNYTPGPSRTPAVFSRFRHFDVEEDTELPQLPEAESSDNDYETIPSPTDEHDATLSLTAEQPHLIRTPAQRQRSREPSLTDTYLTRKRQDLPQRRLDSAASAEPLPPQSFEDFASHEDRHVSARTAGDGASTQTAHNRAPLVAPPPGLPASPTVAGDSRARRSTTNFRARSPGSTRATVSLSARKSLETHRRKLDKMWELRYGPLLAKKLPNGKELPPDFAEWSRADQELTFALLLPPHRGREAASVEQEDEALLRRTGLPAAQVQHMMAFTRGRRSTEQPQTAAPAPGPSTSRSGSGAAVQRDPNSFTAVMPPPPPPTRTSLPRSADAQSSGLRPVTVSEAARPSTTTAGAASRIHAGSRARAFGGPAGAASSSSRGVSASLGVDSSSRSSVEPGSSQASNVSRPQRRRDPVASTTAYLETLHLGVQPSGTDPGEGPGSSNRKRKDR